MSQVPATGLRPGTTASLRAELRFFRQLLEALPMPVFYQDATGRYLGCNKAFEEFFGIAERDLSGKTAFDIWPRDLAETYHAADEKLRLGAGPRLDETEVVGQDGARHAVLLHRANLSDDSGCYGIVGVVTDMGPRKLAERFKQQQLRFVEQLIDAMPSPVFYKDTDGRFLTCNRAYAEFVGKSSADLVGKTVYDIFPKDLADVYHAADVAMFERPGPQTYEALAQSADGSRHHAVFHRAPIYREDGTVTGLIAVAWDVTERERTQRDLQEMLREQVARDPLTALFNRRYLDDVLTREFARASRGATTVGVIMADLDHFKRVNDSFGHACGDEVLRVVAKLLADNIRKGDVACRYGGEEFTIVMPGAALASARARAEQIAAAVRSQAIVWQGRAVGPVTLSLGVALFPDSGNDPRSVLAAADAALLRAKVEGRDRVVAACDRKPRQ